MSRTSDSKKARRKKRKAARDPYWIPDHAAEQLEIAGDLEDFDRRLTERGWLSSDEADDEVGVVWYWPPSDAEVDDDNEQVTATVVLLTPQDNGEIAHVVFVGSSEDYQFNLEELFAHIETFEGYRLGQSLPEFS